MAYLCVCLRRYGSCIQFDRKKFWTSLLKLLGLHNQMAVSCVIVT